MPPTQIMLTFSEGEWRLLLDCADCGVSSLDQEAMRRAIPVIDNFERAIEREAKKVTDGR